MLTHLLWTETVSSQKPSHRYLFLHVYPKPQQPWQFGSWLNLKIKIQTVPNWSLSRQAGGQPLLARCSPRFELCSGSLNLSVLTGCLTFDSVCMTQTATFFMDGWDWSQSTDMVTDTCSVTNILIILFIVFTLPPHHRHFHVKMHIADSRSLLWSLQTSHPLCWRNPEM